MPRRGAVQKEKRKRGRPPKKKRIRQEQIASFEPATQKQDAQQNMQPLPNIATACGAVKADAPETSYFVLCNGKPVKNIRELADVLGEIEDQVFNFHLTPEKNDFATWIKDVFKDVELAEKLAGVKDKKHMQLVLYRHITHKLW